MAKQRLSRQEKADKRKKRNTLIVGAVLIFLMIFSLVGVFVGPGSTVGTGPVDNSDTPTFDYNGYNFEIRTVDGSTLYFVTVGQQEIPFYSTPFEALSINVSETFKQQILSATSISFTSPSVELGEDTPLYTQYLTSISQDLSAGTQKVVRTGYLSEDFFGDVPVITCDDASASSIVLVADEAYEITQGIFERNQTGCYDMRVATQDLIKVRDYMMYVSWGII